MRLHQWLNDNRVTRRELGQQTGACDQTIARWVNGLCPNGRYLRRLKRATKGAVTVADFWLGKGAQGEPDPVEVPLEALLFRSK